jgi:hypothetical protein
LRPQPSNSIVILATGRPRTLRIARDLPWWANSLRRHKTKSLVAQLWSWTASPLRDLTLGRFLAGNLLVGTTLKIVYLEPEEIHGTSYFPMVAVRYRTDDGKEKEENWSPGTEKTSASIDKDSLKKILRARTVAISADDDRGLQVAMKFDMPDPTLDEEGCSAL